MYAAYDGHLGDSLVALKVLHPQHLPETIVFKRFINEALLTRKLSHPSIVRTHDICLSDQGEVMIAMELVEGVTLGAMLRSFHDQRLHLAQLSPDDVDFLIGIFSQIVTGVGYAHKQGIIHRDLKPANILLTKNGDVKITDFGTARLLSQDSKLTQESGGIVGTPQYMAPEQITGDELTAQCDVYALGILAYELFTGNPPFDADNPLAAVYKQLHDSIPDCSVCLPPSHKELSKMIEAATQKDRSLRLKNTDAVLEFYQKICEQKKIDAMRLAFLVQTLHEKRSRERISLRSRVYVPPWLIAVLAAAALAIPLFNGLAKLNQPVSFQFKAPMVTAK